MRRFGWVVLVVACGGGNDEAVVAPPDVADAPDAAEVPAHFAISGSPFPAVLSRDGVPVATIEGVAVALADPSEIGPGAFFDPHQEDWHDLTWRTLAPCGDDGLGYDGGCQFLWTRKSQGDVTTYQVTPKGDPGPVVNVRVLMSAPKDEQYYGLGEYFDSVTHRGRRRAMHIEADTTFESGYNEAHVPIPLLIGTHGWGLFVEDRRPGDFDVAATDPERIRATFEASALTFHLIAADRPMDVLKSYVALTGKPALPAPWAFGGWLWRDENKDQAEVLSDAQAIRDNDLPISAMWIDRPWATAHESFIMEPSMFPDPPALVKSLHESGFRLAFWSAPYLEEKLGEPYQTALKNGWFVEPSVFLKFGRLVDLTNPDAATAFKALIQNAITLGAEGFKMDYAEDVQVGIAGAALQFTFDNGETEKTMHHGYAAAYHKPYAESVGGSGQGFILSRAGTYGDQTLTTTIWPGDLCNTFFTHREEVADKEGNKLKHVGGLPAAIIAGLSLSTSGYPFFASDTGGYRHGRPTKEVFLRWAAYSALNPVMQTGGGSKNSNPWDFAKYEDGFGGTSQFDEETVAIYRKLTRLHIQLYAYFEPYARATRDTGRPVTAPLGFAYPELGTHPDFVYLVGDDLLAAPVHDATGKVTVELPPGTWYEWWTGEPATGTFTRDVALDTVALYAREGAIVPLLRDTVDTLSPAMAVGVDSFALDPGVLTVRVYPTATSHTAQSIGDTAFTWDGQLLTIQGTLFKGYRVELHGVAGGAKVKEVGPGSQTVTLP